MQFTPTVPSDLDQIEEWQQADVDETHHEIDPHFWLTGSEGSFLCFALQDLSGPVFYVRLEEIGQGQLRLHCQFAPEQEVSKSRVAKGITENFPKLIMKLQSLGYTSLVFETRTDSLATFMMRMGFKSVLGTTDYFYEFRQGAKEKSGGPEQG